MNQHPATSRVLVRSRILVAAFIIASAFPVMGEPALFPAQVTDARGHSIKLNTAPTKVVSLSPSLTESLFAVGAGDVVRGVTTYCNYPPEVANIDKIGGFSAKTISIEAIVALEPDIVFADLTRHVSVIEALERYDINVVATNATSIDEIYGVITMIGVVTGNRTEALAVVEHIKSRIDAVSRLTSRISEDERPGVFWEVFDEPLMTAGPQTFIGQLIDLAGGINIFADVSESWPKISHEELLARNPDVLMSSDSHGERFTLDVITSRTGWKELSAVRNGRIYLFNGDMVSRPGPRVADALEAMVAMLYPELF